MIDNQFSKIKNNLISDIKMLFLIDAYIASLEKAKKIVKDIPFINYCQSENNKARLDNKYKLVSIKERLELWFKLEKQNNLDNNLNFRLIYKEICKQITKG